MKTDSDGEGHGGSEGSAVDTGRVGSERDTHRQPLGNVVQRDGEHQERRRLPVGFDALDFRRAKVDVQVRNQFVKPKQEERPREEAEDRRNPRDIPLCLRHFDGRSEEAPVAGGDHDSAGESKHSVEDFARKFLKEKDEGGARGGHEPREGGRQEREQYGVVGA